jgi:hypothetical protein
MGLAQTVCDGKDDAKQASKIENSNGNAEPNASPIGRNSPQPAIPKALRQEKQRYRSERKNATEKHPAYVQVFGSLDAISIASSISVPWLDGTVLDRWVRRSRKGK